MPIYEFECKCGYKDAFRLPIEKMDEPLCCPGCDSILKRLPSLPQPAIIKKTAKDMALNSINSKYGLSPHEKGKGLEKSVMDGLERNRPMVYKGISIKS
jgi:putative FmdB family regulatory protein